MATTGVFSANAARDSYLLKNRAVILVSPDENLCDGADGLHKKVSVVVSNRGVFGEHVVHVPVDKIKRQENVDQRDDRKLKW